MALLTRRGLLCSPLPPTFETKRGLSLTDSNEKTPLAFRLMPDNIDHLLEIDGLAFSELISTYQGAADDQERRYVGFVHALPITVPMHAAWQQVAALLSSRFKVPEELPPCYHPEAHVQGNFQFSVCPILKTVLCQHNPSLQRSGYIRPSLQSGLDTIRLIGNSQEAAGVLADASTQAAAAAAGGHTSDASSSNAGSLSPDLVLVSDQSLVQANGTGDAGRAQVRGQVLLVGELKVAGKLFR
jgi:hypothetical protein